ncbi:MAG: ATP-dependent DNA helicase RuvB [Chlamydiae bacterium SM23_39]|nr:MAG: ATP-dependent DNA helicase RuvB [Chlamydiae bacterium SM23_39]
MFKNSNDSSWKKQDKSFESSIRPNYFDEFMGQEKIKKQLEILIGASLKRQESLCHCLFSGPPGLGKTTLANIISKTLNTTLVSTSGPVLEKPADLAGLLTSLKERDILFIDEIHRLAKNIEEYLYPAMEEFKLDLLIDTGPNARSVQITLNKFTLIGATTRSGIISSPMRSRFIYHARLDYYPSNILAQIIERSANILNTPITQEASHLIAKRARGTPRIANNLLRWVRDFTQMAGKEKIDHDISIKALNMLYIDDLGLDEMDKKILSIIIDQHEGGPVGINTIAIALGEDSNSLIEVYEPYLIMQGFLKRTPRGREATKLAYEHMKKKLPKKMMEINQ